MQKTVITGGSTGIGKALALELAGRGHAIGLTARRLEVLEAVRDEIRAKCGGTHPVELAALDVCAIETVSPILHGLFDKMGGIDRIVVNAGINGITRIGKGNLAMELAQIQTNVCGAMATVNAAAEHFLPKGKGHIVGISSLASLQPVAGQAAYSASKAGFAMYLKAAGIELRAKGIDVTDILPGYVITDIVEGVDISKMAFAVPAEQAAREMARLIERRVRKGIVPAFPWRLVRPILGHLPDRFAQM